MGASHWKLASQVPCTSESLPDVVGADSGFPILVVESLSSHLGIIHPCKKSRLHRMMVNEGTPGSQL